MCIENYILHRTPTNWHSHTASERTTSRDALKPRTHTPTANNKPAEGTGSVEAGLHSLKVRGSSRATWPSGLIWWVALLSSQPVELHTSFESRLGPGKISPQHNSLLILFILIFIWKSPEKWYYKNISFYNSIQTSASPCSENLLTFSKSWGSELLNFLCTVKGQNPL